MSAHDGDSAGTITSVLNIFSPPSTSSSNEPEDAPKAGQTLAHSSKLVYEIVNNIFDEQRGYNEVSSSECESLNKKSSEYSFDKRLKYWRNVLKDRKKIDENIQKKTGKKPAQVLFNRMTTVDDREKQTVKTLMDYAERMKPLNLLKKQPSVLPDYVKPETCQYINALQETLPKAERDGAKIVEITGIPEVIKKELLGPCKVRGPEKNSLWIKSKVLQGRIREKYADLERVIEFYPDIDNLQIVGESLGQPQVIQHDSDIMLLGTDLIKQISSDTSLSATAGAEVAVEESQPQIDYCVKINDHIFQLLEKRSAKNVETEVRFECDPFEKVVKRVLHLENWGKKALNFEWVHRTYYEKNAQLLKSLDDEFVFDRLPFRLLSGESRDIIVQYQPRRVDVVKEKWMLKVDPQFFCRKVDTIVVRLSGKCKAPAAYVEKINTIQKTVVGKSNMKMMRKLTTALGSITPLIKPPEVICPYKRTLTELELFEFYNIGYKCERYHDLKLLKAIYDRLKKPREPMWDLKLETLKALILRQSTPDQRALVFDEMMGILREMRGEPTDLEVKVVNNPERQRALFVYVRGMLCTGIDEWEELTIAVEEAFLKTALKEYYDMLAAEEAVEEETSRESEGSTIYVLDEEELHKQLTKEVRHQKAFRDSLYMQTYTHLCDFIEDIVSVIESTDIV